jgi:hypothetical protein
LEHDARRRCAAEVIDVPQHDEICGQQLRDSVQEWIGYNDCKGCAWGCVWNQTGDSSQE